MTTSRSLHAGVIGYPLKHSISPEFQQPAFDAAGLDVRYRAYETPPEDLPRFLDEMCRGGWLGCNVTIPHKLAVYERVDELTPEARAIGAVNTVICRDGRLIGHNTDATGFLRALSDEAGFDVRDKEAVLLGAGGAALAVALAVLRGGARRLTVANRSLNRARDLADRVAPHVPAGSLVSILPLDDNALRAPLARAALLVNSTSVGMSGGPAPEASPVTPELLGPHLLVYDLVYNPPRTPLLRDAEARGASTLEGLPMLIYQGAASFEEWTGLPAPLEVMMEAGRTALAARLARHHKGEHAGN